MTADDDREGPPTEPPTPITAADVLRSVGDFKKELFQYLEDKEKSRGENLERTLNQRDDNVLEHFREMRTAFESLHSEISKVIAEIKKDLERIDEEIDENDEWREEFRHRTHGIRNAMTVLVGRIHEIEQRVSAFDGKGEFQPIKEDLSRMMDFRKIVRTKSTEKETDPSEISSPDGLVGKDRG